MTAGLNYFWKQLFIFYSCPQAQILLPKTCSIWKLSFPVLTEVFVCFPKVLVEHASRWKTDEDPLPLLEVYTVAILSFAKAASCLSSECENVPLLLEKLSLWVQSDFSVSVNVC